MQNSFAQVKVSNIDTDTKEKTKQSLLNKFGENVKFRTERGVEQAANLWREEDGSKDDFVKLCTENFIGEAVALENLFKRVEYYNEITSGYFNEMTMGLKQYLDLDWGEVQPMDLMMGGYDASAHFTEDMYKN